MELCALNVQIPLHPPPFFNIEISIAIFERFVIKEVTNKWIFQERNITSLAKE